MTSVSVGGQAELAPDRYREVIGHFMSGVTVITATEAGLDYGMTASAVTSLSLEPPMLLVCLNRNSTTQEVITRSGTFGVSVLAEGQHELAKQFSSRVPDRFTGVPTIRGRAGVPLIRDALAVFQCEVSSDLFGDTHHVFLARVVEASARQGTPLAYFRGTFGRVALDLNARALELVRHSVVTRRCALDLPLDVDTISQDLELPQQLVHQALLTLAAEGLVTRRGEADLVVTAVDRRVYDQAFRARTAIELGAAELTVGRVSASDLHELRNRAWATAAMVAGGQLVDVDAYIEADRAFHEHLVGLAQSDALVDAYRRLSFPALMTSLLEGYAPADAVLSREHLAVVDAYEAGSLDEVRRAITAHNDHARAIGEAALLAGGGRF